MIRKEPLKSGLVCKVCQQGIMNTRHEPCPDVCELVTVNTSSVAINMS
jgi:hypothetical protein